MTSAQTPPTTTKPADYLDMPDERRAAAIAHCAVVSATVRKTALTLQLNADVDDFRRVLTAGAK